MTALLQTVAAHGLPGSPAPISSRPVDPVVWRSLLVHARRERIIPLLAQAITDGAFPATDAQVTEVLELDTAAMAAVLTLEAALVQLAETLRRAGIPFQVLKGPAVAHLDYPDPSLRDFGDIDLLIHAADIDRTIALLAEQGYSRRFPEPRVGFDRRFTKSVSVVDAQGQEFDLHRTLASGVFGQRVDVEMLWDGTPAQFTLAGVTLRALGSAERLVHACYHAALGNAPPRLVPQRDIAQMLLSGAVDPDRVMALASAWQGDAVVTHAITTAWSTLGLTDLVPLSAWAARYQATPRHRRELTRATSPGYTHTAKALDSVRAIPPRDRLVYMSTLAFPRRGYINGRHSGFTTRFGHAISELLTTRMSGRSPRNQQAGLSSSSSKENRD